MQSLPKVGHTGWKEVELSDFGGKLISLFPNSLIFKADVFFIQLLIPNCKESPMLHDKEGETMYDK